MGSGAPYYQAGNQGAYNMGDYNNSQVLPGTVYAHEKPAQDFGQSRGAGGQWPAVSGAAETCMH